MSKTAVTRIFLGSILAVVAGVFIAIGAVVAWVGALLNTAQLEDKTWFVVLLVLGLFSFGWLATAAYVIAGPDSSERGATLSGSATVPTG
jgi:hypothetical protein